MAQFSKLSRIAQGGLLLALCIGLLPVSIARGETNAFAILGSQAWFRPRDSVVYYLDNPKGEAINLILSLGDLNLYLQGKRGAIVWVIGPDGKTLLYTPIADDGIVSGNFRYKEGMSDVYADARYRGWAEYEAGLPLLAGKERSPLADDPAGLATRRFSYRVPASGKGVYRVVLLSCWDHWVSLETQPPLAAGIASGPGPLSLRAGKPFTAWMFNPGREQKVGFSIVEEIKPYAWKASIADEKGKTLARIKPKEFFNFAVIGQAPGAEAMKMDIEPGANLASFHVQGIPPLLSASAETARRFRGGRLYPHGDSTFAFPQQVILDRWLESLDPGELRLPVLTAELLPGNARFAKALETLNAALQAPVESAKGAAKLTPESCRAIGALLESASFREKHPALTHALALRIAVACAQEAMSLDESFCYRQKPSSLLVPGRKATLWNTAYRTNWLRFQEADLANIVAGFSQPIAAVMPGEVVEAWHDILDLWALARGNYALGECSNQWCMILSGMAGVQQITGNPELLKVLHDRVAVMTDGNGLGRTNPLTPRTALESTAGYGFASDMGMTGAGYLGEAYGYDGEYTLEQILYIHRAWHLTGAEGILKWFNADYDLKTHLSLPWKGEAAGSWISEIVSPTDINFRTTKYTHKTNLPADVVEKVRYGTLWQPVEGVTPEEWPCNTEGDWTKTIDNRFHFLNRHGYYAIVYTGETKADWSTFDQIESDVEEVEGALQGHLRFAGYGGMGYLGFGRKATKPGGLSALYLKGFGVALLSQNVDVPYTHTVWGRAKTPVSPVWDPLKHDPYVVAATYDPDPVHEKAPKEGLFTKIERMRHAPLQSSRRLVMDDEGVKVELDVTALDDLDLPELYESVPLVTQSRMLSFILKDGSRKAATPETIAFRALSDASWEITALELTNEAGAGLRITFSKAVKVRLAGVTQHRPEVPQAASVQVVLDGTARKGTTQSLSYTLTSLKAPPRP